MTNEPPPYSYPPPGGPPPMSGARDRTSLYGWLGIVLGFFCCAIVGIVLGALSLREAKRFNQSPVLGYVAIAVSVLQVIGGAIYAAVR
jgi:hypothetical protein